MSSQYTIHNPPKDTFEALAYFNKLLLLLRLIENYELLNSYDVEVVFEDVKLSAEKCGLCINETYEGFYVPV